jgi:hypothetical protein
MFSNRATAAFLVLLSVVLGACSMGEPQRFLDVTPSVELPASIGWSSPFEIVYTWEPGAEFDAQGQDFLVFVHFVDEEGVIVAQDDHEPPVPTRHWHAGRTIQYRRWFRLHSPADVEHLDVIVGLYDENGRIAIQYAGERSSYLAIGGLTVRLEDMRGVPIRGAGWYDIGRDPSTGELWHWMGRESTVVFENPRVDCLLHIEATAPVDWLGGSQRVRIFLHEVKIADFRIDDDAKFRRRFPVSAVDLGEDRFIEFEIRVARAVVPSEVDPDADAVRRLGLKVFYLHLNATGPG